MPHTEQPMVEGNPQSCFQTNNFHFLFQWHGLPEPRAASASVLTAVHRAPENLSDAE